jgi:hypothetical protein
VFVKKGLLYNIAAAPFFKDVFLFHNQNNDRDFPITAAVSSVRTAG